MNFHVTDHKLIQMPIWHVKHTLSMFAMIVDHGPLQMSEGPYFAVRMLQALYEQFYDAVGTGQVNEHSSFELDLQALVTRLKELGAVTDCDLDGVRECVGELVGTALEAYDSGSNRVTLSFGEPPIGGVL